MGAQHSKGNKTVPEKEATTCTEDGHKQTMRIKEQETRLTLHEHDDDDYDDDDIFTFI